MENQIEVLQQKITLYNSVNDLYERVQQFCEGVFFEVVVEPQEPGIALGRRLIFNLVDFEEYRFAYRHVDILDVDPELKERLRKIERLQDNYKLLVDTVFEAFLQLKEEYKNTNYRVIVYRRQREYCLAPRLEFHFDGGEENHHQENARPVNNEEEEEEEDDDEGEEEEEDWDTYSDDSGLDPETDVESDRFIESEDDWESDVDSGLQSDTDSQSEMEMDSDPEPEWF